MKKLDREATIYTQDLSQKLMFSLHQQRSLACWSHDTSYAATNHAISIKVSASQSCRQLPCPVHHQFPSPSNLVLPKFNNDLEQLIQIIACQAMTCLTLLDRGSQQWPVVTYFHF